MNAARTDLQAAIARDAREVALNRQLPDGPWTMVETETRIAIKAGTRTVAYIALADNDYEIGRAIAALPQLIEVLRTIKDGRSTDPAELSNSALVLAGAL